jgi:hypothetical protein
MTGVLLAQFRRKQMESTVSERKDNCTCNGVEMFTNRFYNLREGVAAPDVR